MSKLHTLPTLRAHIKKIVPEMVCGPGFYYKYKKQLKITKVGMVEQKSKQTRVVGKITDKVHPTPIPLVM